MQCRHDCASGPRYPAERSHDHGGRPGVEALQNSNSTVGECVSMSVSGSRGPAYATRVRDGNNGPK